MGYLLNSPCTLGAGCPIFHFRYAFNRKKMVVELNVVQESTALRGAMVLGDPLGTPVVFTVHVLW